MGGDSPCSVKIVWQPMSSLTFVSSEHDSSFVLFADVPPTLNVSSGMSPSMLRNVLESSRFELRV